MRYDNLKEQKYALEAEARFVDIMLWSKIRKTVLERDNHTCQLCGSLGPTKLHVHHILKKKDGGKPFLDNLLTVCPKCNYQANRELYNPDWESKAF